MIKGITQYRFPFISFVIAQSSSLSTHSELTEFFEITPIITSVSSNMALLIFLTKDSPYLISASSIHTKKPFSLSFLDSLLTVFLSFEL